ncbi:hypothetical protein ACRQ5I_02190 [Pseudoramibacter alactolyticus]|uniref:hypothetical protein n=1 Tax=Pseudoramibacter alactolyticus TaxID=113287 RepID=UPI0005915D3C|nr:hypothetical protein [Pseudoramibacter alactolyticus]
MAIGFGNDGGGFRVFRAGGFCRRTKGASVAVSGAPMPMSGACMPSPRCMSGWWPTILPKITC